MVPLQRPFTQSHEMLGGMMSGQFVFVRAREGGTHFVGQHASFGTQSALR